jgi:hypothetical protein
VVECVDRLYLNAYVLDLQVGGGGGGVFFTRYRGNPIPSPAWISRIGNRFRRKVEAFVRGAAYPQPGFERAGGVAGTTASLITFGPT